MESWSWRMKEPYLTMWWTAMRHLSATEEFWVVWRRSMRASMAADAVARELWPKERRVARCLADGGEKGSWVVARRRARWRD